MEKKLQAIIENHPIIPAIKDEYGLKTVINTDAKIVFLLYGDVLNVVDIVRQIHDSGKMVFVNVDLLDGFASKEIVLRFIKKNTPAVGILSSKANMLKAAREMGFHTIHRLFIIDSFSFNSIKRQIEISNPDYLEILPGWPRLVTWVMEQTNIPIISGGLICYKDDIVAALGAGATATCSTNPEVWSA